MSGPAPPNPTNVDDLARQKDAHGLALVIDVANPQGEKLLLGLVLLAVGIGLVTSAAPGLVLFLPIQVRMTRVRPGRDEGGVNSMTRKSGGGRKRTRREKSARTRRSTRG